MPIERPEPTPIHGECDECGKSCELEELEEGGLSAPVGWVTFRISRTIPNPDYIEERDAQALFVEQALAHLKAQVEAAGGEWTSDASEQAKEDFAAQAEPESDPYYLQEMEAVLCPKHAEFLQTRLGVAEWPSPEEEE